MLTGDQGLNNACYQALLVNVDKGFQMHRRRKRCKRRKDLRMSRCVEVGSDRIDSNSLIGCCWVNQVGELVVLIELRKINS